MEAAELIAAADGGDLVRLRQLLVHHRDLNQADADGCTLLYILTSAGNLEVERERQRDRER
jgi:hypothetical protein